MKAVVVFFAFLFFLHFANPAFVAGLVINEFSSASSSEWVEIYNSDEQTYSLQNVVLFFDGTSVTQKVSFCDNDQISAKSFKLITRPSSSYWLANSGDTLILKKEDDVIDSISYGSGQSLGAPTSSQSASRIPDGGSWVLNNSPSPQGDEASFVCPTPTPTPTNSPTPTPTSTTTPAATSTPSPTPTKTLTPTSTSNTLTSKITPSAQENVLQDSSSVLGESTGTRNGLDISAPPDNLISDTTKKPDTLFQGMLMLIGAVFIVICVILTVRIIKKGELTQNEGE